MNKTTEALKLAEEALTGLTENDSVNAYFADKRNKALAAIREALAEPDIEEMTLTQIASRHEPVQEPVAWLCECSPQDWNELNADERSVVIWNKDSLRDYESDGYTITAFYTTPPVVAQGEPVAWISAKESFCGFPKLLFSEKYKDGYKPVYLTPPSVEAAIEATKEKAAKVCEDWLVGYNEEYDRGILDVAAAIRSMK